MTGDEQEIFSLRISFNSIHISVFTCSRFFLVTCHPSPVTLLSFVTFFCIVLKFVATQNHKERAEHRYRRH